MRQRAFKYQHNLIFYERCLNLFKIDWVKKQWNLFNSSIYRQILEFLTLNCFYLTFIK